MRLTGNALVAFLIASGGGPLATAWADTPPAHVLKLDFKYKNFVGSNMPRGSSWTQQRSYTHAPTGRTTGHVDVRKFSLGGSSERRTVIRGVNDSDIETQFSNGASLSESLRYEANGDTVMQAIVRPIDGRAFTWKHVLKRDGTSKVTAAFLRTP